ncbi:hypothetical protein [Cellulomonas sp. Leaf395]|uniref:hypothetical protein n=1 Tax=Cellulomonas sp. Leaf395 TaxID=1736362 RepID=UPI0006FAA317|nr:hypothetical protein [Cellulomonas sp. Leaf395]KQT01298.1 hypothetical protein ASG23_06935 [Cellulomonas sp. Leaf395]
MDQIMDGQVHRLVGDPANRDGLGKFRIGVWTTAEYAFYLRLMRRVGDDPRVQHRADEVEAVLFRRGQDGK